MKELPLLVKVMKRKGPISCRTRSQMGTPRLKTLISQYPFKWWGRCNKPSVGLHNRAAKNKDMPSVSLGSSHKLDEKDGSHKPPSSNRRANRTSACKESFAKSKRYHKKRALSTKLITKSLIELVRFMPVKNRNRGEIQKDSLSSKRMRKARLTKGRAKSKAKPRSRSRTGYRKMARRNSKLPVRRRRSVRRKKSKRPNKTVKRRTSKRRSVASKKKTRLRMSKKKKGRSRKGRKSNQTQRRGRKSTRTTKGIRRARVRKQSWSSSCSSCSDSEGEELKRKRVFYHGDFFNKEQTQVLNEPYNVNYDNTDRGHDDMEEDPLDNVSRKLVQNLHGTPADNRNENKDKNSKENKPELEKETSDGNQGKKKKKKAHNHTHTNKSRQKAGKSHRRRRTQTKPKQRQPTKPRQPPNQRKPTTRYSGLQIMDDARKKVNRYAKKVKRPNKSKASNAHSSKPNGKKYVSRHATQRDPTGRFTSRTIGKHGRRSKTKPSPASKRLYNRKPRDRNNNFLQRAWYRVRERLWRMRDLSREILML